MLNIAIIVGSTRPGRMGEGRVHRSLNSLLDHVIAWSGALSVLRKQEGRS